MRPCGRPTRSSSPPLRTQPPSWAQPRRRPALTPASSPLSHRHKGDGVKSGPVSGRRSMAASFQSKANPPPQECTPRPSVLCYVRNSGPPSGSISLERFSIFSLITVIFTLARVGGGVLYSFPKTETPRGLHQSEGGTVFGERVILGGGVYQESPSARKLPPRYNSQRPPVWAPTMPWGCSI